ESYTAIPYTKRPRPARPTERPAYQGSNPVSDIWSLRALEIVNQFLPRAVADTSDDEARSQMLLASAMAGIGFGNAGVHLPHGMSLPGGRIVPRFPPARLSRPPPAGPPRHRGDPHPPGRLPLHGPRLPRASPALRGGPRGRRNRRHTGRRRSNSRGARD